jgi:hypothetical protein
MKRRNLIYNHNIFDAPYLQKAVKATDEVAVVVSFREIKEDDLYYFEI